MYNLKLRHIREKPYTRTGDIVIAVNPYQWYNNLYSDQKRNYYSNRLVWDRNEEDPRATMEPHVYEVSALAYKGLATGEGENQSILVSGESGAGKTETVKICLNHIATVQKGQVPVGFFESSEHDPVVKRVVESNPLLEAFGNAKTRRNDNSSRFGKYLQLQFKSGMKSESKVIQSARCGLVGSKCDVYLLEKNRVVGHSPEERTFHIFYQLLSASDEQKCLFWEGLHKTTNESFKYVGRTRTDTIEGVHDADRFQMTLEALELVGVSGTSLKMLIQAICIVMQLGNLNFTALGGDGDQSVVDTTSELQALAGLMGISKTDLGLSFTERTFVTEKETCKVHLNPEAAKEACDALAKEAYQKTFLWLVKVINEATCADESKGQTYRSVGLLDIFGFESFPQNRFEQLCINYANEKLQQKFTEDVFKNVQAEYKAEGISLDEIHYDDNTDVLDLIEGQTGLLNLLNEECIRPKGNDADFVHKALRINKTSPTLIVHKTDRLSFGIHHYAGKVWYDAEFFVSKNMDTLPTDLQACIEKCSNKIISAARSEAIVTKKIGNRFNRKESNITAPTVWTKYKSQLSTLMTNLRQTRSRYIRCIKPNTQKAPLVMEHTTTIEQLRCAGVVAGITIARSAFPNRLPNSVVLARYSNMWDHALYPSKKTEVMSVMEKRHWDCKANMESALKSLEYKDADGKTVQVFVVGKTKTFFKIGALEFLEANRMTGLDQNAVVIQRAARGWLARNGGRHTRQQREMEEKMREAARLAEQERLAKLAAERSAKREARLKAIQALVDQVATVEKSVAKYSSEQDQKVRDALAKNEAARREIEELKARFAREKDNGLRQRQIEMAEQEKLLTENAKLIGMLKKENKRARKERSKFQNKHEEECRRQEIMDTKSKQLRAAVEELDDWVKTNTTRHHNLTLELEKSKADHIEWNQHLSKKQDHYLEEAKARLKLQKATAKIITAVQEGSRDRTIVEETVVTALKAESVSKGVMAALDVASLEPDLTINEFSDLSTVASNFSDCIELRSVDA